MSARRFVEITLLLVLWYFLAGLIGERVLEVLPRDIAGEAFFLARAALPWSLLALDFVEPARSGLGAVVRDLLFFAVAAGGIAINAGILYLGMRRIYRFSRLRAAAAPKQGPAAGGQTTR